MSRVIFDGKGEMPELNRITAKKNYASSSQSHKMGATAMFNDILHYLAEEKYPALLNEAGGLVAVRQHPVYAFQKIKKEGSDEYTRKFIGLFTVGADKGDKNYFGFTDDKVKDKAVRLEGTDHIKGVGFNYPYRVNGVKKIRYNHAEESLCIVTGSDKTKWTKIWEQSYCAGMGTEEEIEAYLEEKYMPAYELAYSNNPLIVGVDMTLDSINADIDAFGKLRRTNDDRQYSYCEFWIDGEYDLYYLDAESSRYEKNGINILTDLGITEDEISGFSIDEKNDYFIRKRVERFKDNWENYFCKEDAVYQLAFLFIICASDNFEKNMYPYLMDLLWRFFQDDLDSIFSTDNQGQDTKSYSAELHDFTDDSKSAYVFKGEDSAFWQLVELACPSEFKQMGHDILQSMYDLAPSGTTTTEKLMSFFDEYFFSKAQNYFPCSAYNNDTEYSYEEAWNNKEYVASVDIHPLAQALGSHESTERAWLEKRIIFLMSKFGFGGFSSYNDTALGVISVRTQDAQSFTLTPAIDMYPAVLGGQAQIASAAHRTKAGEAVTLPAVGGGNTNVYIVGADWLSDIGDLKDLKIDPSSVVTLSIASKRLRRLKVGDENAEEVTSYLASLAIQRCDSLELVDARNLQTLIGTVDLSNCPRLVEALFGGTNTTAVIIAAGSKIERLELSESTSTVDLRDTRFLEDFHIGTLANVRFLRLENVPSINAFAVLKEAYNTEGQQLKDIRLVGWTYNGDAADLDMIANLATDKDKEGNDHPYNGIGSDGVPDTNTHPVLEGQLNIDGYVYEETADIVRQYYPTIEFTPKGYYIRFKDPEVLRVLLANGVGDGTGVGEEQAESVKSFKTSNGYSMFKNNKVITQFEELERFVNVALDGELFGTCTSLERIRLNELKHTVIGDYACSECSSLKSVNIHPGITTVGIYAFSDCTSLEIEDLHLPNLETLGEAAFRLVKVKKVSSLGNLTTLPVGSYALGDPSVLEEVILPDSIKEIPQGFFSTYAALKSINLSHVETLGYYSFMNCSSLTIDVDMPNLKGSLFVAFHNSGIKRISNLGSLVEITDGDSYMGAFSSCLNLTEAYLPDTLKVIGKYAFYGDKSLTALNIPQGVTDIKEAAFYGCTSLAIEDLSLPNLETLGGDAFYGTSIKKVSNLGKITNFPTGTANGQIFGKKDVLEEVVLPDTLKFIKKYAFFDYSALTTCHIPESVTSIGERAFQGTSVGGELYLPNLTEIGDYVFYNTSITKIVSLGNVQYLSSGFLGSAFENCKKLTFVRLPESIVIIRSKSFKGCPALQTIICEATTPPSLGNNVFGDTNSVFVIYVPDASVTAYREASGWSDYADRIKPLSEYTE